MDQQTLIKISADKIIDEIKPITHYGRKEKDSFTLFKSSDKKKLEKELSILDNLDKELSKSDLENINSILESIKNIDLILLNLESRNLYVYEIFEIKKFIYFYNELKSAYPNLPYLNSKLDDIFSLLNPNKRSDYTFYVYDQYSKDLSILRKKEKRIRDKLNSEKKKVEENLRDKYNILLLSDEFIIPKFKKNLIKTLINSGLVLMTRESFSNIYFSIRKNEIIEKLEREKIDIKKKIEKEERKVLEQISQELREKIEVIKIAEKEIGKIDFTVAKLRFIKNFKHCKPIISNNEFYFNNLEFIPISKRSGYTPVSVKIQIGLTVLVGTNMGGKSTFLKTLGLTEFMLKYGLLLPAEYIKLPLLDDIFFVNEDIESESLSSFAINVQRLNMGLEKEKNTLLLIDEFAKGTNPIEGNALAKSLAKWIYINRKENFTIFATHFMGPVNSNYYLLKVGKVKDRFDNIHSAIDHSIEKYKGKFPMEALKISKFLGLNKKIIEDAKESVDNDLSQRGKSEHSKVKKST